MEIVTGHRGTPHVTPYKVRDFNIGIVGAEDYVMNGGSELEAQLVSNNRIDIKDGSICMQGTHAVIPKNINDELTIENGMQGEKRIDLIVARYEKVADSGVESVNTVVLQGTPSKESPIVPGHVVGDIRNGDLKHEMPLYEVELDGINVIEVRPVFKKIVSAAEQQKMIELLNGNFEKLVDGNKYSVSAEIDTGEVWHDGRKIYKRTFVTTESIVFKTPITIPITGVAMSEFWIDTQNSFISTASVCYPLPMVGYGGDPDEHIYVWLNSSGIRIGSTKGGWGTGWKKTVTIRYTKL